MPAEKRYDLLLKGGAILDPAQALYAKRDVALANGRVAAIADRIDPGEAREVIYAVGKLVTPGLIDIHGHYCSGQLRAVDPDESCLPNCVTTGVDAGSAGWLTFRSLRDYIIPAHRDRVRLLAFLHIGSFGLAAGAVYGGELQDERLIDVERTAQTVSDHRDLVLGIKVRMHFAAMPREQAKPALLAARQAADQSRSKLMVHVSGTPIPLPEVLEQLGAGDIATHILNGNPENILDSSGKVRPEVWAAHDRGVVMDVAHAGVHCDLKLARAAIEQGFIPTTISTDIHVPPPERKGVYQMPDLISTFMALGMSLEECVAASTSRAAAAIGLEDEIGSLRPGMAGDIAVFELQEGQFTFWDSSGNSVQADRRLVPQLTVKGGAVVWRR